MNNTITLPQTLCKKLEKISADSRLSPQSIVRQAIADRIDYEEWLLERVDAGIADADTGLVYSREVMLKKLGIGNGRKKAT
jgi:predicted transcriptional regulator